MNAFALRGLFARKLRTALTALAIVLGVAMVSGTYVLTDSITKAFDAIFTDVYQGTDATVTGRAPFDLAHGQGSVPAPFEEAVLQAVLATEGVDDAIGGVAGEAQLVGADGRVIAYGGAPNLGFSVDPTKPAFNTLVLVEGDWPATDEVVIDASTVGKADLVVGAEIGVQAAGQLEKLRISGVVRYGGVDSIGGATLTGFDLATAQRLFGKKGQLDQIRVRAEEGVEAPALVSRLAETLPQSVAVRTGEAQAREDSADTNEFLRFLQDFLLAFAGISLFVGSFVIGNALSITIAQRTREFATLRTLGASRAQVLRTVLLEAFVVGVIASAVGLLLGLGLARGLFWLFDLVGFTLPNQGLVFETRTAVVSMLVGTLTTVGASLRPAMRATRVPPIAAVREGATLPESRFVRLRTPGAVAAIAGGFAALAYGLFRDGLGTTTLLAWLGVGALLVFIGVTLFSARLIRPLAGLLGQPGVRLGGVAGRLARDNARRNPQRTASTASALMIGLALVTLVATLAAGIVQTFTHAIESQFDADFAVTAQNNFTPIPIAAAEAVAAVPGIEAIGSVRTGEVQVFGKAIFATAVDPGTRDVLSIDWVVGSKDTLATLGQDGAIVDEEYATAHGLKLGSPLEVTFVSGATRTFALEGILDPPSGGSPFGRVTVSTEVWDAENAGLKNLYTLISMTGGGTVENQRILDEALAAFPNAKAQTNQAFIDNQIGGLSSILNILYVLLALSVLVSLFGIVNTLYLTVFERTREIGMLRAIGTTRRQIRRMIRHESVITALIGGVIGIALGVALAVLLVARVEFIEFALPVVQLVGFAVASIVIGIVAAILPARRAARLDPLEALHYE